MVDITPADAFLVALQNRFDAARQSRGRGQSSGIPGLAQRAGGDEVGNALIGGGLTAGGVPFTATTGASVANALAGGGVGGIGGDPLAQQVIAGLFSSGLGSEPGERGDLGAGVTGGDANLLRSILTGNPLVIATMVANAIAGQNSTIPSTAQGITQGTFGSETFSQSSEQGREIGGNLGGNPVTGSSPGGGSVGSIRSGGVPSDRDRDRGPGPGPNRGTGPSNAGR